MNCELRITNYKEQEQLISFSIIVSQERAELKWSLILVIIYHNVIEHLPNITNIFDLGWFK